MRKWITWEEKLYKEEVKKKIMKIKSKRFYKWFKMKKMRKMVIYKTKIFKLIIILSC